MIPKLWLKATLIWVVLTWVIMTWVISGRFWTGGKRDSASLPQSVVCSCAHTYTLTHRHIHTLSDSVPKLSKQGYCYELNCVSPKKYVEAVTPCTCECDLICKLVFADGIKLKRGHYGGLSSRGWCPYEEGTLDNSSHTGRMLGDNGGRDWRAVDKTRNTKDWRPSPEKGKKDSPFRFLREHGTADILTSDF